MPPLLPPLITSEVFGGNWDNYVAGLYARFKEDLVDRQAMFRGKNIVLAEKDLVDGREKAFWHFISGGSEDAAPNYRRCERIGFVKVLVENPDHGEVRCWVRQQDQRVHISTKDFDFVVVLKPRRTHVLLITAYYVEEAYKRSRLRRAFEEASKS